ncbi:unnamed protein product [Somion occarium]|uniref:Uncharacterized protein n=1 Tax=Somion occarium TaxID=3059160 RepID=A0ABP1CPA0_9APHY
MSIPFRMPRIISDGHLDAGSTHGPVAVGGDYSLWNVLNVFKGLNISSLRPVLPTYYLSYDAPPTSSSNSLRVGRIDCLWGDQHMGSFVCSQDSSSGRFFSRLVPSLSRVDLIKEILRKSCTPEILKTIPLQFFHSGLRNSHPVSGPSMRVWASLYQAHPQLEPPRVWASVPVSYGYRRRQCLCGQSVMDLSCRLAFSPFRLRSRQIPRRLFRTLKRTPFRRHLSMDLFLDRPAVHGLVLRC